MNEFSNSVSVISGTTVVANVSVQSYPPGWRTTAGTGKCTSLTADRIT